MPNQRDNTPPRHASSPTNSEQSDSDFPPIRIGTDVPLLSVPPGTLLNRNRYRCNAECDDLAGSKSDTTRSSAALRTSDALNKPSSSKKVDLHS